MGRMLGAFRGRSTALEIVALAAWVFGCSVSQETPRHLVLVSLDTVSALHLGAYGYARDTSPSLDRLAREGVMMEHAYTPQVWTLTAHASLLTGLYPAAHGAGERTPISGGTITLAEALWRSGFQTYGVIGPVRWLDSRYGFDRGFARYTSGSPQPDVRDDRLRKLLQRQAALAEAQPQHRFFLFLHYYEPHSDVGTPVPYWAPEPFGLAFMEGDLRWERRGDTSLLTRLQVEGEVTERDREVITALYDGGVRYTDEARLRQLLLALRETGLEEQTLLVVTSDHGEEMFQHDKCLHQQPYEETSRVPLVLRGPGVPKGMRIPDLVELVDVMPTVLSLLGLPAADGIQGRDLTPLLRGETLEPRPAHVDGIFGSSRPYLSHNQSSIVARIDGARWSYVQTMEELPGEDVRRFRAGSVPELYLLDDDPGQTENLADSQPEIAARLEAELLAWYDTNEAHRKRIGAERTREDMLDAEEREQLRALGYSE